MDNPSISVKPQRLRKLLQRMVDIYSPSGKEEEILEFLHRYLKRQGLPVVIQPVDENRYNLLVIPSEVEVQLAMVGHLDTVVAYDLDDFGYAEEGDLIQGLGTADMKGGCAAMVEAFLAVREAVHEPLPMALCLVVGEEESGDGAESLVEEHHFPWALVGEPTNLKPCLSHYGYMEMQLFTSGKRMHASLANTRQSPVETMLRMMIPVTNYLSKDRPGTVYNIRDLFSSQSGFAVPDWCEAWLDVHLPPDAPIGEIATDLEDIVARERAENTSVDAGMRVVTIDGGYDLPEKGPLVEGLKSLYDERGMIWEPQAFRSHSDANRLWAAGIKSILLGPGQIEKAHAPEESVSFSQTLQASELYAGLALKLLPR
jgi:acetylornithine deacetylase